MRQMRVVTDTDHYHRLLATAGPSRYRTVTDAELATLAPAAYILTGNKTQRYGNDPSPDGFVLSGGKMIGRLRLADRTLRDGYLTV